MANKLYIGTTVIDFPTSGTDANWALAVNQFASAVEKSLAALASPFDVSPRVETLINDENLSLPVPGCIFSHTSVRSFVLNYSIYRTNGTGIGTTTLNEVGKVSAVYNTASNEWNWEQEFNGKRQASGDEYHTFFMIGDELHLKTIAINGSYDSVNSKVSYSAKTLLINNL